MIVGLGNPGPEYRGTRHNVGFEVIEKLAAKHKVKLTTFKSHANYTTWETEHHAVLLVKPMTFMNLSGKAVAALARQYSLLPDNIIVIADDLDLETGVCKMKPKGGSGGHNGHKSIIASLGTDEYPRIKIGIGKSGETVEHVLSKFHTDEKSLVTDAVTCAVETCEEFCRNGVDAAMRVCNN